MSIDHSIKCGISRFVERDIDLFVAEEICTNPAFSEWFIKQGGGGFKCIHPALSADISVVEDGSEADVSALFEDDDGNLCRLFIENKIAAQRMPEQLERYVRRAKAEVDRGITSSFTIKFFTPESYSDRHLPEFVEHITFDQAADFLLGLSPDDLRLQYRASFLRRAGQILRSSGERDRYNAQTQPFIKEWWDAVYERLENRYPGYFLHKTRYPASVYFAPHTAGLDSKMLRVDLKGHKGEVDLALKTENPDQAIRMVSRIPNLPGQLVENKKSVSIRISGLPKFVISDGIAAIDDHVMPSYDAAYILIEFWKNNEAQLRDFMSRQNGASETP